MTIPTLTAARFEGVLTEGRTHPLVLACRPPDGRTHVRSVVCKAIGCPTVHATWQLVAEIVGNAIARRMGVHTPPPCIVEVDNRMAGIVNQGLGELGLGYRITAGFAAGCDLIPGLTPFTLDQTLTPELRTQAGRLFTFDQMSQNPDRRRAKVNCGLTKNGLLAFDFELCFSHCFLTVFGQGSMNAWEPSNARLAQNHLFYGEVKVNPPTESSVHDMALALSPDWWDSLVAGLPEAWREDADKIGSELRMVFQNAADFAKDVTQRCLL